MLWPRLRKKHYIFAVQKHDWSHPWRTLIWGEGDRPIAVHRGLQYLLETPGDDSGSEVKHLRYHGLCSQTNRGWGRKKGLYQIPFESSSSVSWIRWSRRDLPYSQLEKTTSALRLVRQGNRLLTIHFQIVAKQVLLALELQISAQ